MLCVYRVMPSVNYAISLLDQSLDMSKVRLSFVLLTVGAVFLVLAAFILSRHGQLLFAAIGTACILTALYAHTRAAYRGQ